MKRADAIITPTVRDHRGRSIPIVSPNLTELAKENSNLASRIIRIEQGDPRNDWRQMVVRASLLLAFLLAASLLTGLTQGWMSVVVKVVAIIISGLVATWLWQRTGRRKHLLVNAFLAAGRCGACAYPIADQQPHPDNCRICPECGGGLGSPPQLHPQKTAPPERG